MLVGGQSIEVQLVCLAVTVPRLVLNKECRVEKETRLTLTAGSSFKTRAASA